MTDRQTDGWTWQNKIDLFCFYTHLTYLFKETFLGLRPRMSEVFRHSSLISLTSVLSVRSCDMSISFCCRMKRNCSSLRFRISISWSRIVSLSLSTSFLCSCVKMQNVMNYLPYIWLYISMSSRNSSKQEFVEIPWLLM